MYPTSELISRTSCSEWAGGYLIDVDVELGQTVKNQFSLIDEDIDFVA